MTTPAFNAVAAAIIAKIEAGAGEYQMPWHGAGFGQPINALTRKPYRGMNILSLWGSGRGREFVTFKQALEMGHPVRKGEKSCAYIFKYATFEKEHDNGDTETVPFIKTYPVFAVDQLTDYPLTPPEAVDKVLALAECEEILRGLGVPMVDGGTRAYYSPAADHIGMPQRLLFTGTATSSVTEAYYSTWAHECVHATGHEKRLNREFGKRFGDGKYAAEELVAELGAAFFCAEMGISNAPRVDHAQYLASWLRVLKSDARTLWTVASKASAAVELIMSKPGVVASAPLALAA